MKKLKQEKVCLVCEKPFSWRKKWKKDWENVKYCSKRCKLNKKSIFYLSHKCKK